MSNTQLQKTSKEFFLQPNVQAKFNEILGDKSKAFITSVLQIVNSNNLLANASPMSIFNAAMTAATMDLPINNNLGFAYIVPYKGQAQFQVGYKGFIQLAQRSGQFKNLSSTEVYEGQLISNDPLKGCEFDFNVKGEGTPIGYAAYFRLLNGYEANLYMTREQIKAHALKYSQSYKKGFGVWADGEDGFTAMAKKTVLKLLLSRYAPMSIETKNVFTAIKADQAVISEGQEVDAENIEFADVEYPDNGTES